MNNQFVTTQASIQGKYPRSRFDFPFDHKTSFSAGQLCPLSCIEILPGDTVTIDAHSLVRMDTPIAPIMSNIKQDIFYFFVPRRLLDPEWEKFISYSDWNSLNSASVGTLNAQGASIPVSRESLAHYFGVPIGNYTSDQLSKIISAPFKAYFMIWNTFFRDETYQPERSLNITCVPSVTDNYNVGSPSSYYSYANGKLLPVNEFMDLYTAVLPSPQRGPEVLLPLGETAPLIVDDFVSDLGGYLKMSSMNAAGGSLGITPDSASGSFSVPGAVYSTGSSIGMTEDYVTGTNLVADLSKAVSASINDLRNSILVQHWLEQLARTGNRYNEFLLGFFGVVSPDARLQRPEFISRVRFNINVSEVLQTAGYQDANDTTLGTTGAVSRTGNSSHGAVTYSSPEHGYLLALTCIRHELTYAQGMPKYLTKTKAFDYYAPVFNGLGEQPILKQEVLYPVTFNSDIMKDIYNVAGSQVGLDEVLGYNEAWAEYKWRRNQASGMLNPVAKDGLDYWTLTKVFTGQTINSQTIRLASRDSLDRATSNGSSVDQFIIDYFEDAKITRVMPVKSIPGIDRI